MINYFANCILAMPAQRNCLMHARLLQSVRMKCLRLLANLQQKSSRYLLHENLMHASDYWTLLLIRLPAPPSIASRTLTLPRCDHAAARTHAIFNPTVPPPRGSADDEGYRTIYKTK